MDMMVLNFGADCGDLRLTSTLPILPLATSKTLAGHRTILAKKMPVKAALTTKDADQERSESHPLDLRPRGSDRQSDRFDVST